MHMVFHEGYVSHNCSFAGEMNNLVGYSSLNPGQHTFMMEVMDRHGLTATSQISFKCKSLIHNSYAL